MRNLKKVLILICASSLLFSLPNPALTQGETPEIPQEETSERFPLFQFIEDSDERRHEREGLKKKQYQEREELNKQKAEDKKTLKEKQEFEMKALVEKQKQERAQEVEERKQQKVEEAEKKALKLDVKGRLKEQEEYIEKVQNSKRSIKVISGEEDPILIVDAIIKDGKTAFLKMSGVELNYKIKIKNQTPKIIDRFSFTWQRKLPFDESLNFDKETSISKPLIPYEDRIVEYNELNYEREGEIYLVKVNKIVFQDGTQWVNPEKF